MTAATSLPRLRSEFCTILIITVFAGFHVALATNCNTKVLTPVDIYTAISLFIKSGKQTAS